MEFGGFLVATDKTVANKYHWDRWPIAGPLGYLPPQIGLAVEGYRFEIDPEPIEESPCGEAVPAPSLRIHSD